MNDRIERGHMEVGGGVCGDDGHPWPCDTAIVLEQLAALREAVFAVHETTQVVHVGNGMVRVDVLMVSSDRMAELYECARALLAQPDGEASDE